VTFVSPGGIKGIAGRLAFSDRNLKFSLIWYGAVMTSVLRKLEKVMCNLTNWNWPHALVVSKYATMVEYKQYAPANHLHMAWDLPVPRAQNWLDLSGVLNVTPWQARPCFIEGVDRPLPLIYHSNGGEQVYKGLK